MKLKKAKRDVQFKEVILSYAHLFEPWTGIPGSEPKYQCALLVNEVTQRDQLVALLEARNSLIAEATDGNGDISSIKALPMRKGTEKYPGEKFYADKVILNARSSDKPMVVDQSGKEILIPSKVYSGCIVHAVLTMYTYNFSGVAGITFGLEGIVMVAEGDRLDGRTKDKDVMFKGLLTDTDRIMGSENAEVPLDY